MANAAPSADTGGEDWERGWTGLGLPSYQEEPAVRPAEVVAKPPEPAAMPAEVVAKPPEPAARPAEAAAKRPEPARKPAAAAPKPAEPARKESTAAPLKSAASAPRAQAGPSPPGPPRPSTTKSGAFAAARPSTPTPAPKPAPATPASPKPAPTPARAPAAAPPPVLDAAREPADTIDTETEEERDIHVEDEGEFGATIPEEHPPRFDDLMATVPNLQKAPRPPRFGLPPPDPAPAGAPLEPVAAVPPFEPIGALAPPAPAAPLAPPAEDAGPPPYGPGSIIGGKYRLIRVIGRGGMGAVWIAHNTSLDVEVAIKLMRRDRATPEAAARFTTEARAAAKLGHPSIVRVFDFGETSRGDPFIVMELLHGESFGALLARKKKLTPTVAVQTLLPVAHALAAAHAKGIVHRDLKPDNILLAKDETNVCTPKVVDFGIAKLVTSDPDRHFTIAGEVLGSPDYMSPEQARGEEDIDHRTDIWTFTVLLYEAISGKRPFDGANYNALLAAIIASKPAPITDAGVSDTGLWAILAKGLSKDRDARWQSVREMGTELARWAIDRGAEHDLVGASLSAQWLEPTKKRLFTVQGSGPPALEGSGDAAIPPPPPLGGLAAEMPRNAAPAISQTMPPFVPRRRPVVAVFVLVAAAIVVLLALASGGVFESDPRPAASAEPTASATVTAAAAPTPEPTAEPAPSASASAKPTSSAKTKTPGPFKPKAPQVKGTIKF